MTGSFNGCLIPRTVRTQGYLDNMLEILLNIESRERRCAVLKNGILWDLTVERKKSRQITGNIYRGKVINILHNIQSAFIDIDEQENGFIHISDILENTQKFQEMFDLDFEIEEKTKKRKSETDISKLLQIDQPVLVQVVKEPIGSKGARLTSNVSIAGRYLVMLPNTPHRGVSRKIEDKNSRDRLKKIIRAFEMPHDMGLICRTASEHATTEMLVEEAHDLLQSWQNIVENFSKSTKPTCLYEESDLVRRSVLTALDKKYDRILTDDYATYQSCKRHYEKHGAGKPLKIEYYRDQAPMFERFGVEREIEKATKRKVWMPSGSYLFFDRTEAMYTIDVNSGRSSQKSSGDVESAVVHINMEAAEEIARQLRIRNVGGLVICDFIDMRSRKNQKRVMDRLKEAMKEDTAKCTILGMSEFGLIEMTRQRSRESLTQTLFTHCPYCSGAGQIKSHESISIDLERSLKKVLQNCPDRQIEIVCHPHFEQFLKREDKSFMNEMAKKLKMQLKFSISDLLHLNDYEFYTSQGKRIDV